ncbi:MAG: rhodanese-like domain-containing protein [Gammaproteobacteria bacterium]|nr:rhodanese-like domain-containing protein [Gammaproteobacteria bacterium]
MRIWLSSLAASGLLCAAHTVFAQDSVDPNSLLTIGSGEFSVKGAEKIDASEAWKLHQAGKLFVDARDETFYKLGHIEGAVLLNVLTTLTEDNLAKHAKKDQTVIFYCEYEKCYKSAIASAKAVVWGYIDVRYFAGGTAAWEKAGYPLVKP